MKLIISLATIAISLVSSHAATEKPNILIFLVDDMGLMDTSVPFIADDKGQPKIQPLNKDYRTPNMERLAAQGTRFSHFYANSVCSPSRSSLVTGQYSARHFTTQFINPMSKNEGPKEWNWKGISKDQVTLPRLLKKSGYTTVHIGKAHFGPFKSVGSDPLNVGFDINIAGSAIGRPTSYYAEQNYGKGTPRAVPGLDSYHGSKTFLTEALTLEANKTLTELQKKKAPFFLHMSHYAVHGPFNSDPRFAKNYENSSHPKKWQAFATLVEGMDKSLGDILDHLEAIGEAENTLVFFLGDNGTAAPIGNGKGILCAAPLRGKKGSHYDGGMRAPFIVAWAKPNAASPMQQAYPIKQGVLNNDMVSICDLMPTILDVTNTKAPDSHKIDGHDLKKDLQGTAEASTRSFLMHFPHSHTSSDFTTYFEGDWKIAYHYKREKGQQIELFNLKTDPSESNNLSKSNPERSDRMLQSMIDALDDADAQYAKHKKTGKEMRPVSQ